MARTASGPLGRQMGVRRRIEVGSVCVSSYLCILIVIGFVVASDRFLHWFVLPVMCCGVLIGIDAVDWLRGRVHLFDPVGILGIYGLHFFFLAPLLHVYWDYWLSYVTPPPDWRNWLGYMAWLNVVGLLVYRASRAWVIRSRPRQERQTIWRLDRPRFFAVVSVALVVSGLLQLWVYVHYGGILGYIQAVAIANETGGATDPFRNMGWIAAISESFPILALMTLAVYWHGKRVRPSWGRLIVILLGFFLLSMLFGGLRGSRANTIWALLWAIGIIHFLLRPISKKVIFIGCIFLLVFTYFYGFYKAEGLAGVQQALQGSQAQAELVQKSGRSLQSTILGDLGRSDVQAFLLYRLVSSESGYHYAWGHTYVGDLALLIPRVVWPDRPPTKVKWSTEAVYGVSYVPGGAQTALQSSLQHGLAGEALLNFGPAAVPIAYVVLGLFVGLTKRLLTVLDPVDSRLLVYLFLVSLGFSVLTGDLDNVLFALIKDGAVPLVIVALCSTRVRAGRWTLPSPPALSPPRPAVGPRR
jgi:hypothetical protein